MDLGTWTLVQEPVSFMDAVKAFDEGKTIKCKYSNEEFIYSESISGLLETQSDILNEFLAVGSKEILYGKWFIEEEI